MQFARSAFALLVPLGMTTGCWTSVYYEGETAGPARPPTDVAVLACKPEGKYREVGRFSAHRNSFVPIEHNDEPLQKPDTLEELKSKAAERGCEALVALDPRHPNAQCTSTEFKTYRAACIVYEKPPPEPKKTLDGGAPDASPNKAPAADEKPPKKQH
jgi:hypothetical protein